MSVARGEEVTITFRGKPLAKLVPIDNKNEAGKSADELFGIWKDRKEIDDVASYVREIRKGRSL